jgi:hypothetical protein
MNAFDNGWRLQLDTLNLLNAHTNQITYAYGSLLRSDPLIPFMLPRIDAVPPVMVPTWLTCALPDTLDD